MKTDKIDVWVLIGIVLSLCTFFAWNAYGAQSPRWPLGYTVSALPPCTWKTLAQVWPKGDFEDAEFICGITSEGVPVWVPIIR